MGVAALRNLYAAVIAVALRELVLTADWQPQAI
jgi:hypothetical protein